MKVIAIQKPEQSFRTLLFFGWLFFISSLCLAFAPGKLPESDYEVVLFQENFMLGMRDGTRLATDIYRPALKGKVIDKKLPILLQRTPYGKRKEGIVKMAAYFVQHGYIVVLQDCRGRYQSEGKFTKYLSEPEDGFDTVEGLAKLPYTDGKIGMFGTSYGAHVQACAAKLNPPHLKTIVVNMGGTSNGWDHAIRNNGPLEHKQLTWAFAQIKTETTDSTIKQLFRQEKVGDWFQSLPLKKGLSPLSVDPEVEDYLFEMMEHQDYDAYWKHRGLNWQEYYEQTADIPMIHISGWYDAYCKTATDNYLGLSKIKKSPIKLLMGPWIHGGNTETTAGEVEFGKEAAISTFYDQWHLDWFDHFLKNKDNVVQHMPAVRVFVMGTGDGHKATNGKMYHGGYWRNETAYPLPHTRWVKYYLQANGALSTASPKNAADFSAYTFDPKHPVPTIGGAMASSEPLWSGGAFDQRERKYEGHSENGFYGSQPPYLPLKTRKDVLVFQSETLTEDMELVGPVTVKLFVASSAPDTDFTVKLIDVYPASQDYPAGFEMNITDGILRAKYRESAEKPVLMQPGQVYELTIKPFDAANIFKKGHHLRLDISSSNFPRFEVNPNTGENPATSLRIQLAENTIYHNAAHASYIVLPLVPTARK
ncbi:MAG: CocE/NonD family hydrolase [Bacteroidota bacterium]